MLFSLENIVPTIFSCMLQNPIVSIFYYHMPFFSNVEKRVYAGFASLVSTISIILLPSATLHKWTEHGKQSLMDTVSEGDGWPTELMCSCILILKKINKKIITFWKFVLTWFLTEL